MRPQIGFAAPITPAGEARMQAELADRDDTKQAQEYRPARDRIDTAVPFANTENRETRMLRIIDELFTYHAPDAPQQQNLETIRDAAKHLAHVIAKNTPECADQSRAIQLLRQAVMLANASIVLNGRSL